MKFNYPDNSHGGYYGYPNAVVRKTLFDNYSDMICDLWRDDIRTCHFFLLGILFGCDYTHPERRDIQFLVDLSRYLWVGHEL